jgi:hypothetical protein
MVNGVGEGAVGGRGDFYTRSTLVLDVSGSPVVRGY